MTRPPCKINGVDCPDRVVGCRGSCKRWAVYQTTHAREIENKNRYFEAEAATKFGVLRMKGRNPAKRKK